MFSHGKHDAFKVWFRLDTPETSYVMGVTKEDYLLHLYYGKKLRDEDMDAVLSTKGFSWHAAASDQPVLDKLPLEYPTAGLADARPSALAVLWDDGDNIVDLRYQGFECCAGKPAISGLPQTYTEQQDEAETLFVYLKDVRGLECRLQYTAFTGYDAIARSALLMHCGTIPLTLLRAFSSSVDLPPAEREWIHLHGAWIRECTPERLRIGHCTQRIGSSKGASGHHHNPFAAIVSPDSTEDAGDVIGVSLVYSGNFTLELHTDPQESLRVCCGLGDGSFAWRLQPGESFQTPEAVLVRSTSGIGAMRRTYHRLYRERLCRGEWRDRPRPILLNTWEGVYFDFNRDKLLRLADAAAAAGIELFVLDDGWFGRRNDDTSSLGDWCVNEEKLGCTLRQLVSDIHARHMRFGIWVEPEMVSPDSELYRAHPEWALHQPDRPATLQRTQLVLDLSRVEVKEYIVNAMTALLSSAPIEYVKWDMNRNMAEIGSFAGTPCGELPHRYMLGLYEIMETLTSRFPAILFESCASGGGRFDPGMLYYMPQGWLSDNTDAISRLTIQYGASFVYPSSAMGSHVAAVPSHQVWRTTPLETRYAAAAIGGGFGYELNLAELSFDQLAEVRAQIERRKDERPYLFDAECYWIGNPGKDNLTALLQVSMDGSRLFVTCFRVRNDEQSPTPFLLPLKGLSPDAVYREEVSGERYTGAALMNNGIRVLLPACDYASSRVSLRKESK